MSKTPTIYSLQYLRGVAALLVLLHHLATKSEQVGHGLFSELHAGVSGVDIFFVISGFIMCHIYMASASGASALRDFWQRRVVRILPLYWLLTGLALCVFLAFPDKVNSSGGATSIWKSFLLIPGKEKFLIENGWTLSFEFYFYAIISLSFFLNNKLAGALLSVIGLSGLSLLKIMGWSRVPFVTDPLILEFAFGICINLIYRNFRIPSMVCVAVMVLGAAGLIIYHQPFNPLPSARHIAAGIPAALFVFGVVCFEARIPHSKLTWLGKLGDSSYAMYLFHPFTLAFAGIGYHKAGMSAAGPIIEAIYWAIVGCATLIVSHYLYLYIENPLIRESKGIISRASRFRALST